MSASPKRSEYRMENPEEAKPDFVKEAEEQQKATETGRFKRWLKLADLALGNSDESSSKPAVPPAKDSDVA